MPKDTDTAIREYLARIGSKGGKRRAANYDKATLSKWGKRGGRPPKPEKAAKNQTLKTGWKE